MNTLGSSSFLIVLHSPLGGGVVLVTCFGDRRFQEAMRRMPGGGLILEVAEAAKRRIEGSQAPVV